jgi:glycerol uptake operon antiterminator
MEKPPRNVATRANHAGRFCIGTLPLQCENATRSWAVQGQITIARVTTYGAPRKWPKSSHFGIYAVPHGCVILALAEWSRTRASIVSGSRFWDMKHCPSVKPNNHRAHLAGDHHVNAELLRSWLEQSRIIPSVRTVDNLQAACASPSKIVFLLFGTPLIIGELIHQLHQAGKLPVVNMDLLAGFSRDSAAIEFLAQAGVDGVISTHQDALRTARSHGLLAFQRTFALDSMAIANSMRTLEHFAPDVIELLPAIAAPLVLPMLQTVRPELPVIGCGLVHSLSQINELVQQGVTSVSVSDVSLWIV